MSSTQRSLDISRQNISGYCDLKCALSFKYPETNLTVKNQKDKLVFVLDKSAQSPITFNGEKFFIMNFEIHYNSILTYNGTATSAELIINHRQLSGPSGIVVVIPIITSTTSSRSTDIITDLINISARNVPNANNTSNLNLSNFTLQDIVPKRPFYNYDSMYVKVIAFDYLDAITITNATLNKLKNILSPTTYVSGMPTFPNIYGYKTGELFYNSKGPAKEDISDGIYISCRPTGSSVEDTPITYNTSDTKNGGSSYSNFMSDENAQYFIQNFITILSGCLLFIFVLFCFKIFYGYLTTDKSFKEYLQSSLTT